MKTTTGAITLYARPSADFDARVAHATLSLQAAASDHPGRIVQSTSLGVEDMVVTDLIARHQLGITIATLNTGMLHAQTLALVEHIEARYALSVKVFTPVTESLLHFVASHGDRAMFENIELRKGCCGIRKREPLSRMLEGNTAWVTGLRREQSAQRGVVDPTSNSTSGALRVTAAA